MFNIKSLVSFAMQSNLVLIMNIEKWRQIEF